MNTTSRSGKAARRQLHTELLDFLASTESNTASSSSSSSTAGVKMIDSTNGNAAGRQLYMDTSSAQWVVLVNFQCTNVEFLLQQTKHRLDENPSGHPYFPTTVSEQRRKHERILSGIEYAEPPEPQPPLGSSTSRTCIIIDHDPMAGIHGATQRDDLAFQVYCTLSMSQTLLKEMSDFSWRSYQQG
jgi:hypothetical protein